MQKPEVAAKAMKTELWPNGKCMEDYIGDALPSFPESDPTKHEYMVCDLYLTD